MTRMLRLRFAGGLLVLAASVFLAGCGAVDVASTLEITDVSTGWYDEGVQLGQNRLVPSISLRLRNVSDADVQSIQINAVFHRIVDAEEPPLGDHFVQAIDREGLGPGETGEPLVLRSGFGYSGTETRLEMLQNRFFVDARVEIFGKSGSRPWTLMGEFPIERTLLTE